MKTQMTLLNVDDIEVALEIRMTVKDWKRLLKQVDDVNYPGWKFGDAIRDMVLKLQAAVASGEHKLEEG